MRSPRLATIAALAALLTGSAFTPVFAQSTNGTIITIPPMPQDLRASADRFARLEKWIVATAHHTPGQSDPHTQEIASWGLTELQALWVDANALARTMRNRAAGGFRLGDSNGNSTRIVYTGEQIQTLQRLACVAGGYLDPSGFAKPVGSIARDCVEATPLNRLEPVLVDVAHWFGAERMRRGDDNLFWRRSAILHSDVAMLESPRAVPVGTPSLPVGPRRIRIELVDGRRLAATLGGLHWSLAETLLGFIQPADSDKPAPERDAMVRAWYQATTMWMQAHEQRDLQHLQAGLNLFPDDGDLLFLSGCEHEAYASPAIQVPLEGTPRSSGPVRSSRSELETAASEFSKSLTSSADPSEIRLHLGRVQLLLGRAHDAIENLDRTDETMNSDELRYLRQMFLGQAHESAGTFADARAAYERAHQLMPQAQSPLLAESQLERRADNYERARDAVQQLWGLAPDREDDDPWWDYSVSHTRGAEARVEAVWRSVE